MRFSIPSLVAALGTAMLLASCSNEKVPSLAPRCGDGVVDLGEECDDGLANSDTTPGACRTSCVMARCGDGVIDPDEECDDGNRVDGDGCSVGCTDERTQETKALLGWLRRPNAKPALGTRLWGAPALESILGRQPLVFEFEYYTENYVDYEHFPSGLGFIRAQTTTGVNKKASAGGIITFTNHTPNFVTYSSHHAASPWGNAWDKTAGNIIPAILPGGSNHQQYTDFLDELADYLSSFFQDGRPVPILLRPFHEINGNSFWWAGVNTPTFLDGSETKREVVKLWRFTWEYMTHTKGLRSIIWVWNVHATGDPDFGQFYPGRKYVDVISLDGYIDSNPTSLLDSGGPFESSYQKLVQISSNNNGNPPISIAEFGFSYNQRREPAVWQSKLPGFLDRLSVQPGYFLLWDGACSPVSSQSTPQEQAEDASNFKEFVLPAGGEPRFLLLGDQ